MKFSCSTADLNNAISTVSHSLPVRSPKPILEGILIESQDNEIKLTCTDLNLSIETVVPAIITEEGRVVLPGRFFAEIIRKLPGAEVSVTVGERFHTTIISGSFRTTISGMNAIEYPELPEVDGTTKINLPQHTLKRMIDGTLFAVAADESKPVLTGCLLDVDHEKVNMVALDGFRFALIQQTAENSGETFSAVIAGKMLGEIGKILTDSEEEIAAITVSANHVKMILNNTIVIVRKLEGEFVRYRQIMQTNYITMITVNKKALSDAVDRAGLIAKENKSNLICMKIEDDRMVVTSNSDNSDMEEVLPVVMTGKDMFIAFNIRYLTDVMKNIPDEEINMRFNSNISPCVITPVQGEEYIYMVLPVRVF